MRQCAVGVAAAQHRLSASLATQPQPCGAPAHHSGSRQHCGQRRSQRRLACQRQCAQCRQQLWTRQPAASRQHLRPRCSSRSRPARGSTPQQAGSASPCWCLLVPESQQWLASPTVSIALPADRRSSEGRTAAIATADICCSERAAQHGLREVRSLGKSIAVSRLWRLGDVRRIRKSDARVSVCHGVCSKCVPPRRPLCFILDHVYLGLYLEHTRQAIQHCLPHTCFIDRMRVAGAQTYGRHCVMRRLGLKFEV